MKEKEAETVYIKVFLKNILNPWGWYNSLHGFNQKLIVSFSLPFLSTLLPSFTKNWVYLDTLPRRACWLNDSITTHLLIIFWLIQCSLTSGCTLSHLGDCKNVLMARSLDLSETWKTWKAWGECSVHPSLRITGLHTEDWEKSGISLLPRNSLIIRQIQTQIKEQKTEWKYS